MKQILLAIILLSSIISANAEVRLSVRGNASRLEIDGEPYLILGGELGNSSATCDTDIETIFPKLARMNLNTVLVPAYWELIEPEEGKFDFSTIDKVLKEARLNNLKVVFLWFGAWKNSMSCYAPEWFKRDVKRFPRARTKSGSALEIASAFSPNVFEADAKAFDSLLSHIEVDDKDQTVLMIQIENEIGMLENARDYSDEAESEYNKGVPSDLMRYLAKNKNRLHPGISEKWGASGYKMEGTWREVFGDDIYTDEYFMAWNYARYVERLANIARGINSSRPLYVNVALNSRGRLPGEYPAAGPLAHLKDIWKAAAPSVDFMSPDIYDPGFADWVEQYSLPDNPLFIPEVSRDDSNGAQAYFVFGHHNAIGISPFSIENGNDSPANPLSRAYSKIAEFMSLISEYIGSEEMDGVILTQEDQEKVIFDGDTRIILSHYLTLPWDSRSSDGSKWPQTAGILIKTNNNEYILIGTGVVAKFEHIDAHVGLAKVEEVSLTPGGSLTRVRTLNGDETHQGRHVRISIDDHKALRIRTYRYQ